MRTVLLLLSLVGLLSPRLVLEVPSHGEGTAHAEGCCCAMDTGSSCCTATESSCCESDDAGSLLKWAAPGCACGGGHGPELFVGLQSPFDIVSVEAESTPREPGEQASVRAARLPRSRAVAPSPRPPQRVSPPAPSPGRATDLR